MSVSETLSPLIIIFISCLGIFTVISFRIREAFASPHHFYYLFGNFYYNQYQRGFRLSSFSLLFFIIQLVEQEIRSYLFMKFCNHHHLGFCLSLVVSRAFVSHHNLYHLFRKFYNHQYQYQRGFRLSSSFLLLV